MAARTKVVATTVGPYLRYGLPLAKACAENGTHYADLTGEVLFVRASIDGCDEAARASGARIVHSCGFDSIPSDLAVLLLHQAARGRRGRARRHHAGGRAEGRLQRRDVDSMRAQVEAVQAEKSLRRMVVDPYALSPERNAEPDLGDERDRVSVFESAQLGGWVGPFVMASFNTRIVRRSNALQGWAYGRSSAIASWPVTAAAPRRG